MLSGHIFYSNASRVLALYVQSLVLLSVGQREDGLDALYLLSAYLGQKRAHLTAVNCHIGPLRQHVYTPYLVAFQSAHLAQESSHVASAYLVLLAFTYIYSGPKGLCGSRHTLGQMVRLAVGHCKLRHPLLRPHQQIGVARAVPSGRASSRTCCSSPP